MASEKTSVSPRRLAVAKIRPELEALGFQERDTGVYCKPQSADLLFWVGINIGYKPGWTCAHVNPNVGVRFNALEAEIARLEGREDCLFTPPTLVTNLGLLMTPRRAGWELGHRNAASVVVEIRNELVTTGFSFMKSVSTIPLLLAMMRRHPHMGGLRTEFTMPVLLTLTGHAEEARAYVNDKLAEMQYQLRSDRAAEYYRGFARRFFQTQDKIQDRC